MSESLPSWYGYASLCGIATIVAIRAFYWRAHLRKRREEEREWLEVQRRLDEGENGWWE